jgi:hypothetical protein
MLGKCLQTGQYYEAHLKDSWTGGHMPLLCVVTVKPSCSGGGNVVVA